MPTGAQFWDETGTYMFGPETPLARFLGNSVETPITGGSISVPDFAQGNPFAIHVGDAYPPFPADGVNAAPNLSIAGTTLTVTYDMANATGQMSGVIFWGVY